MHKEGDEGCEAELESLIEELDIWKQKNPGKELNIIKIVKSKSPLKEDASAGGSDFEEGDEGSYEEDKS